MWQYSWAKVTAEIGSRLGAGVLRALVVVVEDQVAVQATGKPVSPWGLPLIGRRVAKKQSAQLFQVDVGLAATAASSSIRARLAPAELAVLDRVDAGADREHSLDVVGHAVAGAGAVDIGGGRRIEALGDPVHAEPTSAGG